MKVLVTGGGGQLADALACRDGAIAFSASQLDVTDPAMVQSVFDQERPDVVVNAAAYTAVDRAEAEPDIAMAVNRDGVRLLAEQCRRIEARLVHVSTDFVFDGTASCPIPPEAPSRPISVYGRTKWEGEQACREVLGEAALIVRTAWVYAAGHGNFVATMLRLMRSRDEIGVVADQIGTPTWARTLGDGILALIAVDARGTHHLTDAGVASWYDFAVAIEEIGRQYGLIERPCRVRPIRTADYPTPATRPAYSVLDKTSTFDLLGGPTPHWRTSLEACLIEWRDPS
jgi:dTDP-4-dehydrorhamnose reductase